MPPRPRGYVEWHGDPETGRWRTRATDADGRRVWLPLPAEIRATDRARARRVALHMQTAARLSRHAPSVPEPGPEGESVEEYAGRWIADRRAAGNANVDRDVENLRKYLLPELGARPMRSITRADLEQLVARLDDRVRRRELAWKTAVNVWGLIAKAFNDAAKSKRAELRVLEASPARDVVGPDRGRERAKQFLWPSEVATLLSCDQVPLAWRHVYACAVYLGLRAGELAGLRARDVDRVRWVLSIAEATTTRGAPAKATRRAPKTQAGVRSFTVEPAVRPLLDALCEASPAGALVRPFRTDGPDGVAAHLRAHLELAGVTRAELFATTATRRRLGFHDLRATFCTWSAIRGDEPMKIMARAGHEELSTTMGYVRAAELLDRELVGEVFPALPGSLVALGGSSPGSSPGGAVSTNHAPDQGVVRRPQRDSNPLGAPEDIAPPHESSEIVSSDRGDTGLPRGNASPPGTHAGTDPAAALRAAAQAAIGAGDLALATTLLGLLRDRAQVVDLDAARRRRAGG